MNIFYLNFTRKKKFTVAILAQAAVRPSRPAPTRSFVTALRVFVPRLGYLT